MRLILIRIRAMYNSIKRAQLNWLGFVCVCVCSYTNVHLFVVFTQYFDITGESREKLFTSLKKFYTHRNFEANR